MNKPSEYFKNTYSVHTDAAIKEGRSFVAGGHRFSVISENIIRIESGNYCDKPTQSVLFRNISDCKFSFEIKNKKVYIKTDAIEFVFDIKLNKVYSVNFSDGLIVTDFSHGNLNGTARTLDMVNGSCRLGMGLVSRNGVAIFDDSDSCVLNEDGTISEREKCTDIYVLAFGNDYRKCTFEMQKLCGEIPLIPRYALGNWWSRYKAYTQQEYLDLMDKFVEKEIPISVATIDMDWHWVKVVERFGEQDAKYQRDKNRIPTIPELFQSEGWTGYSWNTDLFPDYKAMLKKLKDDNYKVTVNLHPAQGVRPFEDQYKEMAEFMGIDPATKQHIKFDITDPKFIEGYFKILHKPYEKDGVDFWWIDWQQERVTKIKGLDPLWALNHYHTLAFSDENKRPLILSRFSEVGSHRYPLGFSGDTFMTWKSLDFQPYFTITAANVNYTWWSHDIGGHQHGSSDDELYVRWVQFGLYSPIMRLHSSNDEFMGKEPWKYSYIGESLATRALRERHALLPYLYTMNHRTYKDGIALCEPIYYSYPDREEAYSIKNEYMFGSELLVVPVTSKINKLDNYARTKVWLPEGRWVNIYTDVVYEGGTFIESKNDIDTMPVFAKEGAIIPLQKEDRVNIYSNPDSLVLRVWTGNNSFDLYEDDGETLEYKNGKFAITSFENAFDGEKSNFVIKAVSGDTSVIPCVRNYDIVFEDISCFDKTSISLNDNDISSVCSLIKKGSKYHLYIDSVKPDDEVRIIIDKVQRKKNLSAKEQYINDISRLQMNTGVKTIKYSSKLKEFD